MNKKEKLKQFINKIPLHLEKVKQFLNVYGVKLSKFDYSFEEIDKIEDCIKLNFQYDESILQDLTVYLGEAVIYWGGGEWTYYESKSKAMELYNKKFGITKISSGKYKGYLTDQIPEWFIKHHIINNCNEKISNGINKATDWSVKRYHSK